MSIRSVLLASSLVAAAAVFTFLSVPAHGDARSTQALRAAERRGEELWRQTWAEGQKSCAECHDMGRNKMRAMRLKAYPLFDREMDRVVTGQQKINHMIVTKSMGQALELGSDDLNALEAYISTLR
ncbi:MAG: hypothetical protein ACYTG6_07510 [Planctomycetota bacterium]|jgi:cytochrome c